MALQNIENLLEKYESGQTSLEEEAVLKSYFSEKNWPAHLQVYAAMFGYFDSEKNQEFKQELPLKNKSVFSLKWLAVSAVAVLFLGVYFTTVKNTDNDLGTHSDPMLAYQEVVKSLELISQSLNKGIYKVNYLNTVSEGVSKVHYLSELENPVQRIFK
ncbi:hypothetical protein ACFSQP_04270 [Bizionia sediminis]|uniref:Uncharacterized protein n=1 Tax=Bizionia sediminis TaxID=1737064 RepID=A0ABW5KRM2_9FLAO